MLIRTSLGAFYCFLVVFPFESLSSYFLLRYSSNDGTALDSVAFSDGLFKAPGGLIPSKGDRDDVDASSSMFPPEDGQNVNVPKTPALQVLHFIIRKVASLRVSVSLRLYKVNEIDKRRVNKAR